MELIRKLLRKPTAADKPVVRELSLDHALLQAKEINKKIKVERAVDEQQEIISKMRKLLKKLTVTNKVFMAKLEENDAENEKTL